MQMIGKVNPIKALAGKTARMVDIHESIHTSDEYETRVLTSWIMEKGRGKYIK